MVLLFPSHDPMGEDIFVSFHGCVANSGTNQEAYFDVDVNGSRISDGDGIAATTIPSGQVAMVSFHRIITTLAAGTHTFKLQWKVSSNTGTLYAGAGTSSFDLHPQFYVREMS
jgi:hypothetical protein